MFYKHILVTTDFSDESAHAFEYAAYQAKMEGTKITVLTVIEDWVVPPTFYHDIPAPERLDEYREARIASATKKIAEITSKSFHGQKVEGKVVCSIKTVATEICDFAKNAKCDLIIMASHGQGAASAFFLGSTLIKVLQHAPCPVLVIAKEGKR